MYRGIYCRQNMAFAMIRQAEHLVHCEQQNRLSERGTSEVNTFDLISSVSGTIMTLMRRLCAKLRTAARYCALIAGSYIPHDSPHF
jgi:hypothetical protein